MNSVALSIYGACLSTVVFAWQLLRAWSERRRISTSYNFRRIEDPGNEVLLINHSPKPITFFNAKLFWGRRYGFYLRRYRRVGNDEWDGEDSDTGTTIDPFKIVTLHYAGEQHFNWRNDKRPKARLYIRMDVVGRRRPLTLMVYRQDSWSPSWFRRKLAKFGMLHPSRGIYIDERSDWDSLGSTVDVAVRPVDLNSE